MMTRSCGGILARELSHGTVLFRENRKSASSFRWSRAIGFQTAIKAAFFSDWISVESFHKYAEISFLID
jgi:hypothetical protein